ncbi:MAG: hypothetical protein ACLR5B_03255 [Blautia sp.]
MKKQCYEEPALGVIAAMTASQSAFVFADEENASGDKIRLYFCF